MGNWNITIRGQGAHHNKKSTGDANRLAAQFVKRLKEAGATIISASITYGSEDQIEDADKYLADRDAIEAGG